MRKKASNAEDKTCRILETAAREFSEKGYAGARMDEIAARAGVNKATIYYHIGDKTSLYEAVLLEVFERLTEEIAEKVAMDSPPEERIRALISSIASTVKSRRHFAPIVLREIAEGFPSLPKKMLGMLKLILSTLTDALEEGRREGDFTPLNPLIVHMTIIGSIMFYASNEKFIGKFGSEDFVRPYIRHGSIEDEAAEVLANLVISALKRNPA